MLGCAAAGDAVRGVSDVVADRATQAYEQDLYVDWQKDLGADDVKGRLIRGLARSGDLPYTRLFTGHRGCGKTTELYRVKHSLETGAAPRKLFVSFLEAERWLDLADVQPQDVVYHMVWQLLADLDVRAGIGFGLAKFKQFLGGLLDRIKSLGLEGVEISADPVSLSIALKDIPGARAELRKLLEERLPRIYDLVNQEVLKPAREELKKQGYDDVLIIVDQLDRIPQKILHEDLTNHESLFLDQAGILRALNCGVLYTIPIELAYSRCRIRLRNTYGSEVLSLPVLPVLRRNGNPDERGIKALCDIVNRRAARAGLEPEELMDKPSIERLCRLSGGHVRSLFVMLREALDRCDTLPVPSEVLEQAIRAGAQNLALPLRAAEWAVLDEIKETKAPVEGEGEALWYALQRDLFVFCYQDEQGLWYAPNPLLSEVPR